MISFWLETVLISNVVQDEFLTVWSDPSDGSADDESLIFSSDILEFSLFLSWNTVAGFVGELVVSEADVVILKEIGILFNY